MKHNIIWSILAFISITYAQVIYTPVTVYTPNGTAVGAGLLTHDSLDWTQQEKQNLNSAYYTLYPNAILLDQPTKKYNCHGYTFRKREGHSPDVWIELPENYWEDSSYVDVGSIDKADIVHYGDLADSDLWHTAVISASTDSAYYSKWGNAGFYKHERTECPYVTTPSQYMYLAKYSRLLEDTSFGSGYDYKLAAYKDITISNAVVDSGANVNIVAGGGVIIQNGLFVDKNANVKIVSW